MRDDWLTAAALALTRFATAAAPAFVALWCAAAAAGATYSYRLLRKARRDAAYQQGRGGLLEYSAQSTVGRVWIRTKTFVEFLAIGLCAAALLVSVGPASSPGWLLVRAVARLLYLGLFISIIAELAYNARRDDYRDDHLRAMLDAEQRRLDESLRTTHALRRSLAAAQQPDDVAAEARSD